MCSWGGPGPLGLGYATAGKSACVAAFVKMANTYAVVVDVVVSFTKKL